MSFFIVIACSWLVVALLEVLAFRWHNDIEADLRASGLAPAVQPTESAYLYPPGLY